MFCNQCGQQLPDNAQFCNRCGNRMAQFVQPEPVTPPKSNKKPLIIVLCIFIGLALIGLSINLLDIYVFNSAKKLEKQLVDTVWCTEPMESVTVAGSDRILSAYTVEFHDDGSATITTYMATGSYGDELEPEDMKVYDTETVSWEISSNRTIEFDGSDYEHKTVFGDDEGCWYIKDGRLKLGKTYYEEDEWDYVS